MGNTHFEIQLKKPFEQIAFGKGKNLEEISSSDFFGSLAGLKDQTRESIRPLLTPSKGKSGGTTDNQITVTVFDPVKRQLVETPMSVDQFISDYLSLPETPGG